MKYCLTRNSLEEQRKPHLRKELLNTNGNVCLELSEGFFLKLICEIREWTGNTRRRQLHNHWGGSLKVRFKGEEAWVIIFFWLQKRVTRRACWENRTAPKTAWNAPRRRNATQIRSSGACFCTTASAAEPPVSAAHKVPWRVNMDLFYKQTPAGVPAFLVQT